MTARAPLVVFGVLAIVGCRERMDHRWDWNRMRTQPYHRSYDSSGLFRNGMAMQLPPPGTVPYRKTDSSIGTARAGGAERFRIFCAVCHGLKADGNSVAAANMDPPRPPRLIDATAAFSDAQLDSVIRFGHGVMPALGTSLDDADRRAIVGYLHTLRGAP